jgi:hypothetical protein
VKVVVKAESEADILALQVSFILRPHPLQVAFLREGTEPSDQIF